MELGTKTAQIDRKTLRRLGKQILSWCVKNLGKSSRARKRLYLELVFDDSVEFCALFIVGKYRVIRVFMKRAKTVKILIDAIIHEYTHHLQVACHYNKLLERYGYKNHPDEIEARKNERKYCKVCWNDIQDKFTQ